ncbi:MAG: FecR domain-containing protein [Deltaproteobacteria bacterium]|nr:FecR domain-containing protein [Deltaproteobacteria bacterium]
MKLALAFVGVGLLAGVASAQTSGRLVQVKGQVWIQPPGASESAAKADVALAPGTRVRTGNDGEAAVKFDDGSQLKVIANSSLELSGVKRQKAKKNVVLLFFGRVWNKVTRATGSEATYEVTTPNAVCGVRGTEFETAVGDDGSVRVRVSEGAVGVDGDAGGELVDAGEEVDADESGVDEPDDAEEKANWEAWEAERRERLRTQSRSIVDKVKGKVLDRKERIEALRARQKEVESKRKQAEARLNAGDTAAVAEIRKYNQELADLADTIAALGDSAETQLEIVDHFADLADDPRFKGIDRKYLEAEAKSLRRVKATLDKLVAEGTDISIEAMEKMLDDMSKGKPTLKDKKGSAAEDLFDGGKDPDF